VKCIYVELPENKLQFIVYLNQCTLSSYVPTAYSDCQPLLTKERQNDKIFPVALFLFTSQTNNVLHYKSESSNHV